MVYSRATKHLSTIEAANPCFVHSAVREENRVPAAACGWATLARDAVRLDTDAVVASPANVGGWQPLKATGLASSPFVNSGG
jgi:hypothetical protein